MLSTFREATFSPVFSTPKYARPFLIRCCIIRPTHAPTYDRDILVLILFFFSRSYRLPYFFVVARITDENNARKREQVPTKRRYKITAGCPIANFRVRLVVDTHTEWWFNE